MCASDAATVAQPIVRSGIVGAERRRFTAAGTAKTCAAMLAGAIELASAAFLPGSRTLCWAPFPRLRHIVSIVTSPSRSLRLRPSKATARVQSSAIRELFALLSRDDVISLAGGFPPAGAIDVDALKSAMARTMSQTLPAALLYGSVQGYEPLRE